MPSFIDLLRCCCQQRKESVKSQSSDRPGRWQWISHTSSPLFCYIVTNYGTNLEEEDVDKQRPVDMSISYGRMGRTDGTCDVLESRSRPGPGRMQSVVNEDRCASHLLSRLRAQNQMRHALKRRWRPSVGLRDLAMWKCDGGNKEISRVSWWRGFVFL